MCKSQKYGIKCRIVLRTVALCFFVMTTSGKWGNSYWQGTSKNEITTKIHDEMWMNLLPMEREQTLSLVFLYLSSKIERPLHCDIAGHTRDLRRLGPEPGSPFPFPHKLTAKLSRCACHTATFQMHTSCLAAATIPKFRGRRETEFPFLPPSSSTLGWGVPTHLHWFV